MVAAEIWGIQSQNISGCVKHYTFNNEETDRSGMSSNVDQRPAKELYFKPFAAAVDAGVGSAMCSYNRVNGTWAVGTHDGCCAAPLPAAARATASHLAVMPPSPPAVRGRQRAERD
jgi:beta-glucosidase-like glycosyl hydrolase